LLTEQNATGEPNQLLTERNTNGKRKHVGFDLQHA